MLKHNPGYNNDPRLFLADLNVDLSLLDFPSRAAQKFNSSKFEKFLNNPSNNNFSIAPSIRKNIVYPDENSYKPTKNISASVEVKQIVNGEETSNYNYFNSVGSNFNPKSSNCKHSIII